MTHSSPRLVHLVLGLAVLVSACSDDDTAVTSGASETGDGDGDPAMGDGDGDGDPAMGDGDGEGQTGDGDGEGQTGDGDGEGQTGDGDGEPVEEGPYLPRPPDPEVAELPCISAAWDPDRVVALVLDREAVELERLHADGTLTPIDTAGAESVVAGGAGEYIFVGTRFDPQSSNRLLDRSSGALIWEYASDWSPYAHVAVSPEGVVGLEVLPPFDPGDFAYWAVIDGAIVTKELSGSLSFESYPRDDGWLVITDIEGDASWIRHDQDGAAGRSYPTWFGEPNEAGFTREGEIWYAANVDGQFGFVRDVPGSPAVDLVTEADAKFAEDWGVWSSDMTGGWSLLTLFDPDDTDNLEHYLVAPGGEKVTVAGQWPAPEGLTPGDRLGIGSEGELLRVFSSDVQVGLWGRSPSEEPEDPWQPQSMGLSDCQSAMIRTRGNGSHVFECTSAGGEWGPVPPDTLLGVSLQVVRPEDGVVFLPYDGASQSAFGVLGGYADAGRCVAFPPLGDIDGVWTIHDLLANQSFTVPRNGQVIWLDPA